MSAFGLLEPAVGASCLLMGVGGATVAACRVMLGSVSALADDPGEVDRDPAGEPATRPRAQRREGLPEWRLAGLPVEAGAASLLYGRSSPAAILGSPSPATDRLTPSPITSTTSSRRSSRNDGSSPWLRRQLRHIPRRIQTRRSRPALAQRG